MILPAITYNYKRGRGQESKVGGCFGESLALTEELDIEVFNQLTPLISINSINLTMFFSVPLLWNKPE